MEDIPNIRVSSSPEQEQPEVALTIRIDICTLDLLLGAAMLALLTWGLCWVLAWLVPGWWCGGARGV
jgi:hypothetical protein